MAQDVIIDTSTLINFLRIGRVDLLAGLTHYRFVVTDHVRAEVSVHYPLQLANLEVAFQAAHLTEVSLVAPPELSAFAAMQALQVLGDGECSAVAAASTRGCPLAKETAERADDAPALIRKIHKKSTDADPLRGLFATTIGGRPAVVEYEPDPEIRETELVPLLEEGGIEGFLQREVLPHVLDAWYIPEAVRTGYEISFTRHFYKPPTLRTLEEIRSDIIALEMETEGLLSEIVGTGTASFVAGVGAGNSAGGKR